MSKSVQEARSFFKKTVQAESEFVEGFESVSSIQIPTIAIPITIDLTEQERVSIKNILIDNYSSETMQKKEIDLHHEELANISRQIKSISAQSVLLHGERIKKAQDILANYRDGGFTKWLMLIYGNRQTPYSMLRYYEFYHNAPQESRAMIESAPKKCVYLLASREGDDQKKLDLVQNHGDKPQAKFLKEIQEAFPTSETDKRKPMMSSTILAMSKLCDKLESGSKHISEDDRADIEELIQRLKKFC